MIDSLNNINSLDSIQQVVVYNLIIPKKEKKHLVSDETIRLAISGFFTTLLAIVTLMYKP